MTRRGDSDWTRAMAPSPATPGQKAFLRRLVADVVLLFSEGRPQGTEQDFCQWFSGVLQRHTGKGAELASQREIEPLIGGLTKDQAIQLINALVIIRDRMRAKLSEAG